MPPSMMSENFHDVWNTFCTIALFSLPATASSSATSLSLSRHPSAPKFSSTWHRFLAPGIGTVPLRMHQLMAICRHEAISLNVTLSMTIHIYPTINEYTRCESVQCTKKSLIPIVFLNSTLAQSYSTVSLGDALVIHYPHHQFNPALRFYKPLL